MKDFEIKEINLTDLYLDIDNPRFPILSNQVDVIQRIVANQEKENKLLNLAKDIVDNGLNPAEPIIVSPDKADNRKYIVLEGNRRICCLKILGNPDLVKASSPTFIKKLKILSEDYKKLPIKKIDCVVYINRAKANRWIKLKHTGENAGVGTVSWDAQAVARFNQKVEGKYSIALQAIDFLKDSQAVAEETKKRLDKISITNFERLLSDPNVQQVIGVKVSQGKIQTHLEDKEVVKGLTKIVTDLTEKADKKIKVKDIYNKDKRKDYIETFKKGDIPDKTKKTKSTWEFSTKKTYPATSSVSKRSNPLSTSRSTTIPRDCILKIKEPKINKIYSELKDLNIDTYINASSVLLRVFIELSVDYYLESQKIPNINKDSKLRHKVEKVADYLESNSLLDKHKLKGIRVAVNNQNNPLSIDSFNAYVHNRNFSGTADVIKVSWDNFQPFIEKIWD